MLDSVFCKQTVKVNDEVVSSKFYIIGAKHVFAIQEDEKAIKCKLTTGLGWYGAVISLYKDDRPIIESPKMVVDLFL